MMRSLYSGVSGLKTHQTKMDVIGNNIANVNTLAFKSSSVTFSDIMYQTTQGASGANAQTGTGGINAKQIGLGVSMAATKTNITGAGATQTTGSALDVKITGNSFFVVNDGTSNYFTRAGSFTFDNAGNLVMNSTGYTVMGWQVDSTTGEIKKDTVSALQIMNEKNQSSAPEATTKATCSGILDSNSTAVSTSDGYAMNLNFYDSLGYKYVGKFKVTSSSTDGTYKVSLTDVLDSNGNSVVGNFKMGDLFGTANSSQVDVGTIVGSYTLKTSVAEGNITKYSILNSNNEEADAFYYDSTDNEFAIAQKDTTGKTVYTKLSALTSDEKMAAQKSISKTMTTYFKGITSDMVFDENAKFVPDVVTSLKLGDNSLTLNDGVTVTQASGTGTGVTAYTFTKDADTATIYVNSDGNFTDDNGAVLSGTNLDETVACLNKYCSGLPSGFDTTMAAATTLTNTVSSAQVQVTGTKYLEDLIFNTDDGSFTSVGGSDSVTLALSKLGGNFSNVDIDFTQVTMYNNSGTSTMGMESGDVDGTTGAGKKLGALTGVSIDTSGKIYGSYDNGNTVLLGQIAAAKFSNAEGLELVGNNCYQTTLNSGEFDGIGVDITSDGGSMVTGALEMSNVDLSTEFTEMITTQRGFQANSRIITTSDTLLEELINLKR